MEFAFKLVNIGVCDMSGMASHPMARGRVSASMYTCKQYENIFT